jgi:hypothetical protein
MLTIPGPLWQALEKDTQDRDEYEGLVSSSRTPWDPTRALPSSPPRGATWQVRTFVEDIDTLLLRNMSAREQRRSKSTPGKIETSLLASVVRRLEAGRVVEGQVLDEEVLSRNLASLRVLEKVMTMHGDKQAEKEHRQDVMLELGVPRVCMMMIASEHPYTAAHRTPPAIAGTPAVERC